jgi:hypothetical protein
MTIPDAYSQIEKVLELLKSQGVEQNLIESVEMGKKALLANEYSANLLFELYKRTKNWGGIPTDITQNVEDMLRSELSRRVFSNSDYAMMLNQAPSDRAIMAKLLNISDNELER